MGEFGAGTRFDDYELIELIGEGGMGRVYRARQVSLDRAVAIKVIRPEVASQPDFRARFVQEARVAAAVDHPHVVSVHRAGEHEGKPYLVMQWIEGTDLRSLLTEHGALEPGRACGLTLQIASALDAIHHHGLLHRDVKPANVLVRRVGGRDHAYLTDFGVARAGAAGSSGLTRTGYAVGTAGYTAPELVRGEDGDGRSDFYGLSCVLFEALTGERPFQAPNDEALRWAHASEPRPMPSAHKPHLGQRFDAMIARGMAIAREERFADGHEFAQALQIALQGDAPTSPAPMQTQPTAPAVAPVGYQPTRIDPVTPPPHVPYAQPASAAPNSGTPPPPARRRGPAIAVGLVLGALALAGVAVGAIAATGGFSSEDDAARESPTEAAPPTATAESPRGDSSTAPDGSDYAPRDDAVAAREAVVATLRKYERAYSSQSIEGLRAVFSAEVTRRGLSAAGCSDVAGMEHVLDTYRQQFALGTGTYRLTTLAADDVELRNADGSRAFASTAYSISPGGTGDVSFELLNTGAGWEITRVFASC